MYGASCCSDCKRTKQFSGEHRVTYEFVDVDGDADADAPAYVERVNNGKQIIPVVRFDDGSLLVEHGGRGPPASRGSPFTELYGLNPK